MNLHGMVQRYEIQNNVCCVGQQKTKVMEGTKMTKTLNTTLIHKETSLA